MWLKRCLTSLIAASSLLVVSAHAVVYSGDDGTADTIFSLTLPLTVGNHFNALAGGEKITSVSIAWGPFTAASSITVKLWSDPNGDGNPSDANLLSSIGGVTANPNALGPAVFTTYDIPDVTFIVGDSFFVGASVPANTILAADVPVSNQSWAAGSPDFAGSAPVNVGTTFGVDLMIRADGVAATAVEEPAPIALLLIGALALRLSRRRTA